MYECVRGDLLCCFFFKWYGDHRDLHSFPTRRSSDLKARLIRVEKPYVYLEQSGQLLKMAMANMSKATIEEMRSLGRQRFARLMPRVERLREYEWDPLPASYDGR